MTGTRGQLILSTRVDHTATALRSLALRKGLRLRVLAAGLLSLEGERLDEVIADAGRELSSVESAEVRALVVDQPAQSDAALLAQAMAAPSLTTAAARVEHADLLPLFDDEQGCFHSVYQPILELAGRRTVGYEALLRATAADGTAVFPDALFSAAEAAGWLHLLDRVGRTTALRDAGPWIADQLLFINFIPTSIYRPEICLRTTEQAARRAGVRLEQLVFEVTEGQQVHDLDHLERVFDYYRSKGCKVALDDLGAGYSSLNLLVRLKPDIVKLDKAVVQALPDPVSSAVVAAVVSITHAYGGLVLAECVETVEQAQAAQDLGVDLGQGWLLGRPELPVLPDPARRGTAAAHPRDTPVDPSLPDEAVALGMDQPAALMPEQANPPQPGPDGEGGATPVVDTALSALLRRAVDAGSSGVVISDVLAPDSPMIYVNPGFVRMTGYRADESVGRNCRFLQGPDTDPAAVRELGEAIRQAREHTTVLRNYRKDGSAWWNELHLSPVRDEHSRLTHYLGFQLDVTARVEAEQQLVHQAAHDSLTGLANPTSLVEQLDAALVRARREHTALAVLSLGLTGFGDVNDSLGQPAGDSVLVQVAQRLTAALRSADLLARTGGDTFVAVLADLDPLDCSRVAHRAARDIVKGLQRPLVVGAGHVRLSGCVGLVVFPEDAATTQTLLAASGAAMAEAKALGPGQVWSTSLQLLAMEEPRPR